MKAKTPHLLLASRGDFRIWLAKHAATSGGVWLVFGKTKAIPTLTATEALEEALCFGWIDGQMRSVDNDSYVKYFAMRRPGSKWSDRNKAIAARLAAQGLMTELGQAKIEEAKRNGQWDKPNPLPVTEEQMELLSGLLEEHATAHANFLAMSPSVRRTYTRAYFDAKTDAGRANRLSWMVGRLNQNLKPM